MGDSGKFIRVSEETKEKNSRNLFQTDYRLTFALLKYLKINYPPHTRVLDAGCGNGAITRILKTYFNNVDGVDLYDEENPINFLEYEPEEKYDLIVTNSPYSLKYKFIDHALEIGGEVFTLFPGIANCYNITNEYKERPQYLGQISTYPKLHLTPELTGGKAKHSGTTNYVWLHFSNYGNMLTKYEFIEDLKKYDKNVEELLDKKGEV
jgi:SAM-dependent methyltransferase